MDESILEGMRIQLAEKIIAQFYESVEELGYTKEQALELLERGIGK